MFTKGFLAALAATTALASPTPHYARTCNGTSTDPTSGTISPSAFYNYDVGTGEIMCQAAGGKVYKANNNGGHDITTLLTFTYPMAAQGKQCQFKFSLGPGNVVTGSKQIDVYTSLAPAPGCVPAWGPPGNQRNLPLGRMNVVAGGQATWESTSSTYLTAKTPCKAPGTVEGMEIVGVNDGDHIEWSPFVEGAVIVYSP